MAFEPHPWFIGLEGVEHSAEVARMLAWAATSGASGIIEPGDLKVRAQTVPSDSVRIAPGGFVVESKYSGARQQSYIERAPTETVLEVPATGSSGGATRYVVARVTDPDYPGGGTIPAVPNDATYAAPYLVSSLSSTRTEVVLAKIVQPANTAAITNTMITDMRTVANPRRETVTLGRPSVRADAGPEMDLATREADGGEYFPGGAGYFNVFKVDVPKWATQIKIRPEWFSVRYQSGQNVWGTYWMEFGDEYRDHTWPGKQQYEFSTQRFQFDSPGGSTMRTDWSLIDTKTIPAKLRGKTVDFVFKAALNSGSDLGVSMDIRSGLGCDLTFIQAPASDWEGAS